MAVEFFMPKPLRYPQKSKVHKLMYIILKIPIIFLENLKMVPKFLKEFLSGRVCCTKSPWAVGFLQSSVSPRETQTLQPCLGRMGLPCLGSSVKVVIL